MKPIALAGNWWALRSQGTRLLKRDVLAMALAGAAPYLVVSNAVQFCSSYQRDLVARLHLPFEVLSDSELKFAGKLRLPTFELEEPVASQPTTLIKRITLVLRDAEIE